MIKKIFYPQFCVNCRAESDFLLCKSCLKLKLKLKLNRSNYNCTYLDEVFYFKDFTGIYKEIIKYGKYKFNKEVWITIGVNMNKCLNLETEAIISFVPMTWTRYCYRGFNQAKILAKTLAEKQNIQCYKLLNRIKFHGSLALLDKEKRQEEIESAFVSRNLKSSFSSSTKVCYLVDDVYTSGATLNSAAKAIKLQYPELKIVGLCFAKTRKIYN